jgi:hypothetical protein
VKGQPITIGQILANFDASYLNCKIVEILTQILHFLKKALSRWAEEIANISGTNNDTKMRLVSK